jgi:hypothetical protein
MNHLEDKDTIIVCFLLKNRFNRLIIISFVKAMDQKEKKPKTLRVFSLWRILLPVLIGLAFIGFLLYQSWDNTNIEEFSLNNHPFFYWGIGLTLCLVIIRMLAYMFRIIVLSKGVLSLKQSFQVISLWEFASAVTPSIIGGTAVAMFLLAKEKLSLGKSTAIVLVTAFLDELFFILFAPLLFLFVGFSSIFPSNEACLSSLQIPYIENITPESLIIVFFIGYSILLIYLLIISYGIFFNPEAIKRLLGRIFSLPVLKRWRKSAIRTGIDVHHTSEQLSTEPFSFWLKAFVATSFAWFARYLEANFIILAITSNIDHLTVLSRSFVMWIIMMIPTTPGSSGVAETAFLATLCEYLLGYGIIIAFLWRLFSYYPYLLIGVFVLPRWVKRVF